MNRMAVRTCRNHTISRVSRTTACATRATWRIAAAALLCLSTAAPGLHAATLAEGKAAAAAGDHPRAGQIFSTVRDSGAANHRAEAALLALYEQRETGNHAGVQAQYDASLAAARGTRFESRCMFEYAKSLHYNAKDTTEALRLYERISNEYPTEAFSASGSLLETARIQLKEWAAPNTACDTYELVYSQYPDSPFADDALVAQAEAAVQLARIDLIDKAEQRLKAMVAPAPMRQKVQLCRGEYHAKAEGHRHRAAREYMRVFREFPANTEAAAMAKIRAADMMAGNDFEACIRLYGEAAAGYPKLKKGLRDWARCQTGIYQYQLDDTAAARRTFEQLLADKPEPKLRGKCETYLAGMSNPDSREGMQICYDRALRFDQTERHKDRSFIELQHYLAKSRKPFFAAYLADASVSAEERAQMRYHVAYAHFQSGCGREAFETADETMRTLAPRGGMAWQYCAMMRAFLLGRVGRWQEAGQAWSEFADANPRADLMPYVYMEHSRALDMSGDRLGALLQLEELAVRFPARYETKDAYALMAAMLRRNPELIEPYELKRPIIAAKWKDKETLLLASATGVFELAGTADTFTFATDGGAQ